MLLNRNPRANFFHIFGNNLKIRPVRAIKIRGGTTLHGDLSYDTLFAKIRPVVSEEISGQNFREKRERYKEKKRSSPLTTSKRTNYGELV